MVLNSQPEYAELTYAGETVEVTQIVVGLYDERQKVAVSLSKELETDELFGLGMNEEYKDISFGLYASADLTALDGSVIPQAAFWKWFPLTRMRRAAMTLPLLPICLLAATM